MAVLSVSKSERPPGISFLGICLTRKQYKFLVFIFTYLAYGLYHATRKVPSIVKSDLNPINPGLGFSQWKRVFFLKNLGVGGVANPTASSGWAPFNGADGNTLLGAIDVAFLLTYSAGMFFAGHVGDRMDLRIFLTIGMMGTALFTVLFGAGYWFDIHNFIYFLVIQMLGGLFQSTGWPSVMGIVGKWFSKSRRGLIMGFWSSHTSVGNIFGSLLASALLKYGWGWPFAAPSILMAGVSLGVLLFLPPTPESVGAEKTSITAKIDNTDPLLGPDHEKPVGFLEAWLIPGVMQFAICLFFTKLVTYTFLYWLPFYISHTAIGGHYLSDAESGSLSTIFDVGGMIGGIIAGVIYDHYQAGAITSAAFMICTIPALLFYRIYGTISLLWNILLMFIAGLLANAPYALVTTAVTTHLGTHSSLKGNSQALATVAAIVDGTGTIGSAIGPLLTGYLSSYSWDAVFIMLMLSAAFGALVLLGPIVEEVKEMRSCATRSQGARCSNTPFQQLLILQSDAS